MPARASAPSAAPPPAAVAGVGASSAAVFVAALTAYLLTLAPTVTGEDSGELVAAAWTLGVPHPPGYPLWCLVTRLFMLVPVGDVAWRANLGSGVAAAAAAALLVPLLARLGVRPWVAAASALLLAASTTLWSQAVIAEVYGLSLLLLVGLLLCLVAWRQTVASAQGDRWMMLAAFLTTLSLGAHQTVLLLSPLIAVAAIFIGRASLLVPARLGRIAAALLAGLSVQLYLPLRAAARPAMNWGNPDTVERFWAHVTRQQYPSLLGATHTWNETLGQWMTVGGFLLRQWPVPVTFVVAGGACAGLVQAYRRDRPLAIWLAVFFALMSLGFSWLLNFPLDQEGVHIAEVFFIPAWLALVVAFALGAEALAARRGNSPVAVVLTALAIAAFAGNASGTSMRGNDVARRYATDILATLPEGAIVFTSADYEAFPLQYLQIVEGQRPDAVALDAERDLDRALAVAGLAPAAGGRADEEDLARLLRESRLPIYATQRLPQVPGTLVRPVGILQRTFSEIDAGSAAALDAGAWQRYTPMPDGPWRGDWSTASMLAAYDIARARALLAYDGDPQEALRCVEQAAARLSRDPVLMNSLGALLASAGRWREAEDFYGRAIRLRPTYPEANINLIMACISAGEWDAAQEAYARAGAAGVAMGENAGRIEEMLMTEAASRPRLQELRAAFAASPQSVALGFELAAALAQRNRLDEAAATYRVALQRAPRSAAGWRGLGYAEARRGQRAAAIDAWTRALQLDATSADAAATRADMQALEGLRPAP